MSIKNTGQALCHNQTTQITHRIHLGTIDNNVGPDLYCKSQGTYVQTIADYY